MRKVETTSSRPGLRHLLLLVPLVAIAAWVAERGGTRREDAAAVLAALRLAQGPTLPSAEATGAISRSPEESFDRDSLYEYINGAADAFIDRGFERCAVADYTFPSEAGSEIELAAEVYRFATAAGATAQLDADRPTGARPAQEPSGAINDDQVLMMVVDRDLLKVIVLTPAPEAERSMLRLATAWKQEIAP